MTAKSFPEFITVRRRELDLTLGDVASGLDHLVHRVDGQRHRDWPTGLSWN